MTRRWFQSMAATAALLAGSAGVLSAPADGMAGEHSRMLGRENPFVIEDLPPGHFRTRLESLPPEAQQNALEWLHRFDFPLNDLETLVIDDDGGILYADPVPPVPGPER